MGKLQSLEQSLHDQKDHDSQQALLSQQLASFHQVLKTVLLIVIIVRIAGNIGEN